MRIKKDEKILIVDVKLLLLLWHLCVYYGGRTKFERILAYAKRLQLRLAVSLKYECQGGGAVSYLVRPNNTLHAVPIEHTKTLVCARVTRR